MAAVLVDLKQIWFGVSPLSPFIPPLRFLPHLCTAKKCHIAVYKFQRRYVSEHWKDIISLLFFMKFCPTNDGAADAAQSTLRFFR